LRWHLLVRPPLAVMPARCRQGVSVNEWTPPSEFDGYRVVRPLGRGGMGRVFLGHDTLLDRAVAIKFIAASEPGPEWRERFLTEGRAVARLSHPNVVAVYRVGEVSGHPYLITEYVDGETLAGIEKPVETEQLVRLAVGLTRGLAAAHEQGVLHRDLKPTNAMLARSGEPKLLDFGVAKLFADNGASATGVVDGVEEQSGAELSWTMSINSPVSRALGTPMYMAPEVRAGAAASRRSDVFSLGAVLYELWTGNRFLQENGTFAPGARTRLKSPGERDAKLAAAIDRCLEIDPLVRFGSGRELLDALEAIDAAVKTPFRPTGNPYRGLNPFEAEHRSLFFGRESDIESMVGRVRQESVLVVVGDSGVGKSSLCRAGLIPAIEEGQLDDGRSWIAARLVPGRQPLTALAESLAPIVGQDAGNLQTWFREEALALERALKPWLRSRPRAGLVVFVDQAEELFTQADAAESERFSELLLSLVQTGKATRLVLCVRSDFVSRLATLRGLAGVVSHALYLVGPLTRERLRSTIVSPARQAGVSFESDAIVEALLTEAERSAGGLPLLQFALTELWDARDRDRGLVTAQAVESIGGVGGALARHADRVLRQLLPEERAEARRLLMGLVTAEGTRATRTMEELTAASGPARNALEAMIRGRLLVVREVYGLTQFELAHDALVTQWPSLAEWLQTDAELERARLRLQAAAQEWQRLDRAPEALLRGRALRDALGGRPAPPGTLMHDFVRVSRRHRARRTLGVAAVALLVPASLAGVGLVTRMRSKAEVRAAAERTRSEAATLNLSAREKSTHARDERDRALSLFDEPNRDSKQKAEQVWAGVLSLDRLIDGEFVRAEQLLESALLTNPDDRSLRGDLSRLLLDRLEFADRVGEASLVREIVERLRVLEPESSRLRARSAPVRIRLSNVPPSSEVRVERYVERDGLLRPEVFREGHGTLEFAAEPGSYRALVGLPGSPEFIETFLVRPGEDAEISFDSGRRFRAPPGFVLIPEGTFLWGTSDSEVLRAVQGAAPLHPVRLSAFAIARNEVTFSDWVEFLDGLPVAEREHRRPMIRSSKGGLALEKIEGRWRLKMRPTSYEHEAFWGESFRYPGRTRNESQDWRRMPVSGIGPVDAVRYTEWLSSTGRVPGARLCSDREWEKAARGADGRTFTTGNRVTPELANVDETYGQRPATFGPDDVGSHPQSDSPYGIHDMQGNALEIVRSFRAPGMFLGKGGSWYYDAPFSGRLSTAETIPSETRATYLGIRLCASSETR